MRSPPPPAAAGDLLAYCEVHIEQGPVLERRGAPVGVVTTITGQTHAEVAFLGEAGHAGTVPMNARRDALAAAAEWMLAVESVARRRQGTVATVGQLTVEPGARNVIPGEARMTLDVRHTSNAVLREAIADLRAEAQRIASAREVELDWDARGETAAVPTSPDLTDLLADAVEATGHARRAAPERRRPRRRQHGHPDRHRDAVRALRARHQPQPGRGGRGGRRGGRARRARALPR